MHILFGMHKRITYFQVPVHDSVMVAVVDAFQDLLNTMGGIRLAVKFSRNDVLEKLSAGDSEKKLRETSSFPIERTDSKERRGGREGGGEINDAYQGDALAIFLVLFTFFLFFPFFFSFFLNIPCDRPHTFEDVVRRSLNNTR